MIEIGGTEGKIMLSVFGNEPVRLETAAGVEQFDLPNPPHIQQPLIQSIVDELHGHGRCPSTGVTAVRTSRVMDEVLAGYYGGREDAFWARPDGDYMIVPRSGQVFISKAADGILGPYRSMGPSVFPKGIPNLEDPVVFYSGGFYQIVVNSWSTAQGVPPGFPRRQEQLGQPRPCVRSDKGFLSLHRRHGQPLAQDGTSRRASGERTRDGDDVCRSRYPQGKATGQRRAWQQDHRRPV